MPLPDRDTFLRETRIGILTTLGADGSPVSVPVWYEWTGDRARIFSYKGAGKVKRLARDPRAWLLVTNHVGEQEFWVALDGSVAVRAAGAFELAERLAQRYWDLTDKDRAGAVERWRSMAETLVVLELKPERIRTYGE